MALNCVANGKILKEKLFKNIWIQPAAGDAGGSIGAALALWHKELNHPRLPLNNRDRMYGSYLGPSWDDNQIKEKLDEFGAVYEKSNTEQMINKVALLLSEGKAIGWFQGRMEFWP